MYCRTWACARLICTRSVFTLVAHAPTNYRAQIHINRPLRLPYVDQIDLTSFQFGKTVGEGSHMWIGLIPLSSSSVKQLERIEVASILIQVLGGLSASVPGLLIKFPKPTNYPE